MTEDEGEAVDAIFREDIVEQAGRLGISSRDFLTHGRWRDTVRKTALLVVLAAAGRGGEA